MISRFRPITWVGPRTPADQRRSRHTFKAHYSDTVNLLDREIENLGAREYTIEADFSESDIRLDGMPRANARQPKFPGVRVAFDSRHGPLVYQTDSCQFWQHNLRSIALGLEALRAVDRYGITSRAEQYTGFRAIEAGPTDAPTFTSPEEAITWLRSKINFVGVEGVQLKTLCRLVAQQCHPDRGGSRVEWEKFSAAYALLGKEGLL